jgi:tRNA A37 threonylcarbamoyladenosine synthetase subunit TsaC/SUA5/YrdC
MNKNQVYLVQTDTTVGFLCNDDKKLSNIKQRDPKQKTLQVVNSFKTLNQQVRVPKNQRKRVRNSKKTTYIYPNSLSFRVIPKNSKHHNFIDKFDCMYSTSANLTKQEFDEEFALKSADIVVYTKEEFNSLSSSSIFKISNKILKKIR